MGSGAKNTWLEGAVTRLGFVLLWLNTQLPWSCQSLNARLLGWLIYHLAPVRRHVALVNLKICFPELSDRERRVLARRHYQSLVMGVMEVADCWWRPIEKLPRFQLEGLEALEAVKREGRGVILVSGHFTTLEIAGRMLSTVMPLSCLYRDPNNQIVAGMLRKHRSIWAKQAIAMNDLAGLVRALKAGDTVWYAPDQGKWTPQSLLLPFLGEPAITNTSTYKLAEMTGAAVLQFYPRRLPDGTYRLKIIPPLNNFPGGDAAADTLRLTKGLEQAILEAPEQYLWVHRRFKGRQGMPDLYARQA